MSNIGPVVATFPKLAAQKEEKELGKDVVEDADAQGDKVEEGGGWAMLCQSESEWLLQITAGGYSRCHYYWLGPQAWHGVDQSCARCTS